MKNTYEIWIFNFNSTILVNFSIFINLIFLYIFKLIIKLIMPLSWFDLGLTLKTLNLSLLRFNERFGFQNHVHFVSKRDKETLSSS